MKFYPALGLVSVLILTGCNSEDSTVANELAGEWRTTTCDTTLTSICDFTLIKVEEDVNNNDYKVTYEWMGKSKRSIPKGGEFKIISDPSSKFSVDGKPFLRGVFKVEKHDFVSKIDRNILIYSKDKISMYGNFYTRK